MKTTIEMKEFDHAKWINKLKLYKSEIVGLQGSLAEIAGKSNKTEVLARVEHFQNQFIVQKSNVNDILHTVKMGEKKFRYQKTNHGEPAREDYSRERDLAESFDKTMTELKNDFNKFASKWK